MEQGQWRRCNGCKKPIALGAQYWVCSVSTCNRKRTALAFCTVSCWEVHLPVANHREAWAEERLAPATLEADGETRAKPSGRRRLPPVSNPNPTPAARQSESEEVLIVASRLKEYVRSQSGFNTSERVLVPLSEIVRRACDDAIRNAEREGRKTVLDRDVPDPR